MTKHQNESFTAATLNLDGSEWVNCKFDHCTLIYSGGPTLLAQNSFEECVWQFTGGAATTIGILSLMYRSGEAGRRSVEEMLDMPSGRLQ